MKDDRLEQIFMRELERLDEISKKGALDMDELKRLDLLTKSLKQYQKPQDNDEDSLENLSVDDLIKLANWEEEDGSTSESSPESEGPEASS